MRNRIVFMAPATVAIQPSRAWLGSVSDAFNLEASLADQTTMQIVSATQHGQAARLPYQKERTTMKVTTLIALALGLGAFTVLAQDQSGGPGGPPGHGRRFGGPPPAEPLMVALDTNRDDELDATEIANASAALKTLDKDGDGKLSADELMPPSPGGTNQFRGTPPPGAKRPAPPLVAALDTNGDGELDATEIANAGAALLQLDVNGDGKLSKDELRPKGHGGPGGAGGLPQNGRPGGPEGPGGPGQPPSE
jgi:hypothetical protein